MDIKKLRIDSLPNEPGVYIFKGKNGENLYVGKAKNLKNRIKSYFSKNRDKRMNVNFLMLDLILSYLFFHDLPDFHCYQTCY